MKKSIIQLSLAVLVAAISTPTMLAQKEDEGEKVVRRIVIRDGEMMDLGSHGEHDFEAFRDLGGPRTYLGVHALDISKDLRAHFGASPDRGILVSTVGEDTPASKAGIRAGDVILTVNGEAVTSAGKLRSLIRGAEPGKSTEVEILRNGARQKLFATLEQRKLEGPAIHVWEDGPRGRVLLDHSEEGVRKIHELFENPQWKERMMKLQDCGETQSKLDKVQKRLDELEKKLQKLQ